MITDFNGKCTLGGAHRKRTTTGKNGREAPKKKDSGHVVLLKPGREPLLQKQISFGRS